MNAILFWIVPPVIGAVIGYITNAIAIKMLFRPLKEIRLFGIKLPFTPGVLPRERYKLANSIGRVVEKELLTPDAIRKRLEQNEVQEKLKITLGSYMDQMLDSPLASWLEETKSDFPMGAIFREFVNSNVFDSFLEEIIKNWIWGKTVPAKKDESLAVRIKSRFRDLGNVFTPTVKDLVKSGFLKDMKNHAKGEPSAYRNSLEKIIEKYPGITTREFISLKDGEKQKVDSFLAEKTVDALDENIEGALYSVNVMVLVSDRINSLDMLKVEKIILDVISDQLKWINIFGAILGSIIGFLQVLFSIVSARFL